MGICSTRAKRETIEESPLNFWSIEVEQEDGTVQTLNQFKDKKALLLVNVNEKASGSEKGFDLLKTINQNYKNQGVEVLVFPGRKETKPGTRQSSYQINSKLKSASFPVFSSVQLNGQKTHPLYKYLRTNSTLYNPNKKDCGMISSDFTKFLIDRFGNVVKMYPPSASINDIQSDIENLLRLT